MRWRQPHPSLRDPGAHTFFPDDQPFVLKFVGCLADRISRHSQAIGQLYLFGQKAATLDFLGFDQFSKIFFDLNMEGQFAFMIDQGIM